MAQLAYANQSELVVIPLQPATVISKEPEPTSVSAWLSLGESSRPKIVEDSIVSHLNMITDQLIRKCRVKVAVLVDPGVQKQSLNLYDSRRESEVRDNFFLTNSRNVQGSK